MNPITLTEGSTEIYGELLAINNNTLHLDPFGGDELHIQASADIAASLVDRIGQVIGLRGEARINVEALTIQGFTAQGLLPYQEKPLDKAFANLRAAADGCFDHIDPEEFVAEMRSEDW